ncbi:WecB/TagA/CpsF family glycosyltransferase [Mobilicoccus pelagius]|uniref:Putative glycosyltransferase n=1 Tax=Mobilicoccus pelagius NBRC 104925 TaxID=1089455 RepID=H5UMR9_9MICO|nr:WecB/TagA/CpsF family glycosyltransferase [Mobilicoccus pelagius]GAB47027.1 putative glycosyltransferase [Mobilicoccus pelagius NBRC 104925]
MTSREPAQSGHRAPALDRLGATAVSLLLSPVSAARAAVALAHEGRVFDRHERLGADGTPIVIRSFAGNTKGRRLPYLWSVARGDLRFVGPHPLEPEDPTPLDRTLPGLMSPQRLRARTGIDYEPADDEDAPLPIKDQLLLAARYLVAETLAGGFGRYDETLHVLGVAIDNTTMAETLDWITVTAHRRPMSILAFVNSDCLNQAVEDPEYLGTLRRSNRVVPDGIGVKLAARFQGHDIKENLNGTDLLPRLCERAVAEGLSLYLFGARPGVAAAAADALVTAHPGLRIAGTQHGYVMPEEDTSVVEKINASGADILLVALGAPRQEEWLDRHRDDLDVGVAMGVGGLFDFYSGRIPRAPVWVREMGFEWVWRLAQEPGRLWRRYLVGNPLFLRRAASEARRMHDAPTTVQRPPLLNYGRYAPAPRRRQAEPRTA